MDQTLDISWKTITKVLIAGFVLYVLFLVRDMVIWFFFALIIALLLEPAIVFLKKFRLPRIVSVILVYLSILAIIGFMIYIVAPTFILEINQLARSIPMYFENLSPILGNMGVNVARDFEELTADLVLILHESSRNIFKAVTFVFGGLMSALFIFIFAFYLSLEDRGFEKFLHLLTPKKYEGYVMDVFKKAQYKVSGWFLSRILACSFVGIASFIVFVFLDVRYAFILALISGALTFVPFVGPLITAILALLFIGVSQSWLVAFYVVVALTIIQQIENTFLTPLLMQKFINLPPILVLMSIVVGGVLFGFLGMIFMVPVFGIVYEFIKDFLKKRREHEQEEFAT